MAFWDDVKAFFKREAADAKEGFENLKDRFDDELTRREEELAATPSERLDMIKEDIESSGSVFDDIEDKIDGRLSEGDGRAEVLELEDDDDDAAEPAE